MLGYNNFKTILMESKKNSELNSFREIQIHNNSQYNSAKQLIKRCYLDNNYIFDILKIKVSAERNTIENIEEELSLNNDKLITNLQIEPNYTDENLTLVFNNTITHFSKKKNKSQLFKTKKKNFSLSINSIGLKKTIKKNTSLTKTPHINIKVKNINKFINKPLKDKINNSYDKNDSNKHYRAKSSSFQNKENKVKLNFHNIYLSKTKTKFNFPKNIKNIQKNYNELQNIFGEKLDKCNFIYEQMTEMDKKNCISSLLLLIKELKRNNDLLKENNDYFKKENDNKTKNIKYLNQEIKLLERSKNNSLSKINTIYKNQTNKIKINYTKIRTKSVGNNVKMYKDINCKNKK